MQLLHLPALQLLFLFVCVILMLLMGSSVAVSSDPRCKDIKCDGLLPPYSKSYTSDPSSCVGRPEDCAKCLDDSFNDKLESLNFGKAIRTHEPHIIFNNWLSAEISEQIFTILLRETMGYSAVGVGTAYNGYTILCCDPTVIELEKWPSTVMPDDEGYFSIMEIPIGYEGGSGLFVPGYTQEHKPLATAWNAYKYLDEYKNFLPKSFSTDCNLASSKDPKCQEGNYYCDLNKWAGTGCTQGRYVPPQCEGNPDCQEIYIADPRWDTAFFESLIKNTELNFTLVYLGGGGLPQHVRNQAAAKKDMIFYWWEPDPLVSSVDATAIVFKPKTFECLQKRASDPKDSLADCDYGKASILKLARRSDMLADLDLKFMFESFTLSGAVLSSMLKEHTSAGGSKNVWNISCDWVKNNFDTWADWSRNTPTVKPTVAPPPPESKDAIIIAAVVPIVVVVVGVVALIVGMKQKALAATKCAPKKPPLALMFTDVESSTTLWERYGSDMATAMEIHHKVIRDAIEEHECYEVKTIGDAFMIACPSVVDGMMLSLAIQRRLMDADWPPSLKYWKDSDAGQEHLWCGLRVRIGLHHCLEVEPQLDQIHGRYDYYGHDVNVSARVESLADGGQISMTAETFDVLRNHEDFDLVEDDLYCVRYCGGVELKGVQDRVTIYSATPLYLCGRQFKKIEGTEDEDGPDVLAKSGLNSASESASQASSMMEGGGCGVTLRMVFNSLESKKEKQKLLLTLVEKNPKYGVNKEFLKGSFQRQLKHVINAVDMAVVQQTQVLAMDKSGLESGVSGRRRGSHFTTGSHVHHGSHRKSTSQLLPGTVNKEDGETQK